MTTEKRVAPSFVMAGLDPAIHGTLRRKRVDARITSAHDGKGDIRSLAFAVHSGRLLTCFPLCTRDACVDARVEPAHDD
jgi:hypothetical protein